MMCHLPEQPNKTTDVSISLASAVGEALLDCRVKTFRATSHLCIATAAVSLIR
jgi:hypothetical protein